MPSDARPQHRILKSLSAEVRERVYPHLKLIPLSLGAVLCESGHRMRHIYFPAGTMVSLIHVLENGACAEIQGITDAAGRLQRRGIIRYKRGRIRVMNRPALEKCCLRVLSGREEGDGPATHHGPVIGSCNLR